MHLYNYQERTPHSLFNSDIQPNKPQDNASNDPNADLSNLKQNIQKVIKDSDPSFMPKGLSTINQGLELYMKMKSSQHIFLELIKTAVYKLSQSTIDIPRDRAIYQIYDLTTTLTAEMKIKHNSSMSPQLDESLIEFRHVCTTEMTQFYIKNLSKTHNSIHDSGTLQKTIQTALGFDWGSTKLANPWNTVLQEDASIVKVDSYTEMSQMSQMTQDRKFYTYVMNLDKFTPFNINCTVEQNNDGVGNTQDPYDNDSIGSNTNSENNNDEISQEDSVSGRESDDIKEFLNEEDSVSGRESDNEKRSVSGVSLGFVVEEESDDENSVNNVPLRSVAGGGANTVGSEQEGQNEIPNSPNKELEEVLQNASPNLDDLSFLYDYDNSITVTISNLSAEAQRKLRGLLDLNESEEVTNIRELKEKINLVRTQQSKNILNPLCLKLMINQFNQKMRNYSDAIYTFSQSNSINRNIFDDLNALNKELVDLKKKVEEVKNENEKNRLKELIAAEEKLKSHLDTFFKDTLNYVIFDAYENKIVSNNNSPFRKKALIGLSKKFPKYFKIKNGIFKNSYKHPTAEQLSGILMPLTLEQLDSFLKILIDPETK